MPSERTLRIGESEALEYLVTFLTQEADAEVIATLYSQLMTSSPVAVVCADGYESDEYIDGRPLTRLASNKGREDE